MTKRFRAPVSQDFVICEGDEVFGTLRVRPSAILWKPKGSHLWYQLTINQFGNHAVEVGNKKKK